ncbi:MAG: cytochrome c oxidase subunit II [candidate division Zixibacteria bacterium]|nr:cytochrome c oxidase subunit II [candidate division Zixibacteria bacterium]
MPELNQLLGLPEVASAHGPELDYMLELVHWLMLILFVIWAPFFIYTLFRFRQSKNPKASYSGAKGRLSTTQEIGVVVAEVILLAAFAIPAWAELKDDFPDEKDAVVVHVVGEQFAWNMHYPGPDGVFGKRSAERVDPTNNPMGLDFNDPNGMDDIITINELRLPVNKPAIIHLSTKDVIHSFSLIPMRIKQDAIPGLNIPVYFTPVKTGKWEINCAQLCGLGHSKMRGIFYVNSQDEYDAWMTRMLEELREYGR